MIRFVKGNILESETDAIVNTINTMGVMGKGIAIQFKKMYPYNFKLYENAAKTNKLDIGKMFVTETTQITKPRYIINFPTKKHWRNPSKIDYIETGLVNLKEVIKNYSIKSVAIPPLGCGNGGLNWDEVKQIILNNMSGIEDLDVIIYEPSESAYNNILINARPPKLTKVRALVLMILNRYRTDLTLLEAQKLVYFLQRFGENLRLDYQRNLYGPYAGKLVHVLSDMDGTYLDGMKFKDAKPFDCITLKKEMLSVVDLFTNENCSDEQKDRLEKVYSLIEGFEFPFGMELLSTVDFVINEDPSLLDNYEAAVTKVYEWNERKRNIMKPEYIKVTYARLKEFQNYLYNY
ncbi:MAG: macro domain-containing protein [Ignavibacteria bacterium]